MSVPKERLSLLFLIFLNFSQLGIQIGFAVEFAFLMKFLEDVLSLTPLMSSLAFISGPLSGFIVNPIVGALSDRCNSKLGRRRPFIILGTVITALSLLIVGVSHPFLAFYVNDLTAVITVLAGLWLLNIGLNVLATPCRALVTDVVSRLSNNSVTEQTRAQSVCGLCVSIAQVVSNFLIYISANEDVTFKIPIDGMERTMLIVFPAAAIAVLLVSLPSLIVGKEKVFVDVTDEKKSGLTQMFGQLGTALAQSTVAVRILGGVFYLSWIGFFPFQLYVTKALGMKLGSLALTLMSVGSFAMSTVCPVLCRKLGHRLTYCLACLIGACGVVTPLITEVVNIRSVAFFVVGFAFCAINVLPFDILPLLMPKNTGTYYSLLNSALVLAQMTVLGLAAVLMGEHDSFISLDHIQMIAAGSVALVLASVVVWFVKIKSDSSEEVSLLVNSDTSV
ncbi:hypothetical protein RCL1_005216 [Eukaryota sp. TZLM3-RCL]